VAALGAAQVYLCPADDVCASDDTTKNNWLVYVLIGRHAQTAGVRMCPQVIRSELTGMGEGLGITSIGLALSSGFQDFKLPSRRHFSAGQEGAKDPLVF
jgi:hypothetical protein